ncbi:glycerol acyltransferase [Mycolicibacterium chubuense]|uniref:Acyltransferase n=1 Tax=Mycolicibacterium chubuense TaxID=1800 RepID=A0A0J6VQE7_MYCCU|nr:lysophospholipid acyltransferase family protein [Mycolicibacterium chubuense]KMO73280.1 Acyltransferase [Mycolicibacterium chubuense]ORA56722.1 glycerol acyltransferase [Mycolicibacterium chubuense]SPX98815.1 phospholipid/glycerol acyltransferase [Mycolicibacterium chubuense]
MTNPFVDRAGRVQAVQKAIFTVADLIGPVVDLSRIYVDGLENLPRDGRFLLVGNHTTSGWAEIVLTPYFVHRELGVRVRGLATRQLADMRGIGRDVMEAAGAVVGDPETGAELMRQGETVLVFPGGGRDMLKFKGEEYQLLWQGRSGFARLAIAHDYPIVPVGLVGGDDVYHSLVERGGTWERMTRGLGERLHGVTGVGIPLMRGIGPTMVPRPQRMYLRFGSPIDTTRPARTPAAQWEATVKEQTQTALEEILDDLRTRRENDPFRNLNPLAWRRALRPALAG